VKLAATHSIVSCRLTTLMPQLRLATLKKTATRADCDSVWKILALNKLLLLQTNRF